MTTLASCGGLPNDPVGHASDAFSFDDLEALGEAANLVAVAAVREVRGGRTVGSSGHPLEFVEVVLDVEEHLKPHAGPAQSIIVEVEKVGAMFEVDWHRAGTRVLAFLMVKDDPASAGKFYAALTSDSIFTLDGDDLAATLDTDLSRSIAAQDLTDVRAAVGGTH
jgi:hypothetical protein